MTVIKREAPAPGIDPRSATPDELPPISDEEAANPVFQAAQARFNDQAQTTSEQSDDQQGTTADVTAGTDTTGDIDLSPDLSPDTSSDQDEPTSSISATDASSDTDVDESEEDQSSSPGSLSDSLPSFTYNGQDYTPDDVDRMVKLDAWAHSLTPQHHQAIDALFSGQYQLVPVGQVPAAPAQNQSPPSGQESAGSSTFTDDDLADLDPDVAARIKDLDTRLNSFAANQERQTQFQLAQEQQAITDGILAGQARFQTTYELSDADTALLQQHVAQAGILSAFAPQYPGQPALAMEKAMESIYWTTPQWRDRELARRASNNEQDPNTVHTQKVKAKATKASALTGSGGNGATRNEQPEPTDKQGRRAAMVGAIREEMFGGGNG